MTEQDRPAIRVPLTLGPTAEHSLRNHLAIIISFSDLLMRDSLSETLLADVGEIHRAAVAALSILEGEDIVSDPLASPQRG